MASEAELLALAERCEAAGGPDRDIDGWIHVLTNPDETIVVDHEPGRFPRKAIIGPIAVIMDRIGGKDGADYLCASAYTASLDAAMTLIPRETDIALATIGAHSYAGVGIERGEPDSKAATLPLAVCTTALRLRAATMGGTDDE